MEQNEKHTIGLIGHGRIYQYMKLHLTSRYRIVQVSMDSSPQHIQACTLIVYCSDSWSPKILREINRRCRQSSVALLPVYTEFDEAIIGPCVVPQEIGCTSCTELRKLAATPKREERYMLCHYLFGERDQTTPQQWLTSFSLDMLVQLAMEEIVTYLQRPSQVRTHHALLCISLETLDCSRHYILPTSDCPDCGTRSGTGMVPCGCHSSYEDAGTQAETVHSPYEDTAEKAVITLQSCPKPEPFTYRRRQATADAEQLFAQYVDARTGMIQSFIMGDESSALPMTIAQLHTELPDGGITLSGTGCTVRTEQSKVVALMEALERYASVRPRGKRTMVQASYNQLGPEALDPTTLGLYSAGQYAQPDCPFTPYHHDLVCRWVWGYSFQRQSPILVPERCAYYAIPNPGESENPAFVAETSNGCALGNCLEEAIFHGILEVAERDAFLLTWYAQLSVPQLDPRSVTDPNTRALVEHFEYHTGYTLYVFDTTFNHAIPCLWIMGVDEQNREGWPKAHCVAGSDPHPEHALYRGLRELATGLSIAPKRYQQGRTQALEMLTDSNAVKGMPDHSLVYYLPDAFNRLDFLFHEQRCHTFRDAFRTFYAEPPAHLDLWDDLNALVSYYLALDIDVIVVDQTAPEYAPHGFRCVKVLMPGMLPMTFGHPYRRVTNLERLYHLPHSLGYSSHSLTEAELNPHPHPFF
jgi:ribosomal protein S12 methylthiotransferase accessory factor